MKSYLVGLILCLFGSLLIVPVSEAQENKSRVTVLKGKQGKHYFRVRFTTGPFRKNHHRIEGSGMTARIDGKPEWNRDGTKNWWGTDGGIPRSEIYSLEVTVDGRKWVIPKRLWSDCYEPTLRITKPRTVWAVLSPDGRRLAAGMDASDGAGAYYAIWYLRADGRHSREIRREGIRQKVPSVKNPLPRSK